MVENSSSEQYVNIFITRRNGGSAPLWRNVPMETAKRLCSLRETSSQHFMMTWSDSKHLLFSEETIVDDGRYDNLLTEQEKKTILRFDGKQWKRWE